MFKVIRHVTATVLKNPGAQCCLQNQKRNTCVFRRMYPPGLKSKDKLRNLYFKKREYVYILEENRTRQPAGDMELLLAEDIEGLGLKGELVTISKCLGRNHLLPSGQAVYPTEYNISTIRKEQTKDEMHSKSVWTQKTLQQLRGMHLGIAMSSSTPWILNKSHVRVAFRAAGVELNEESIEMPNEPIVEPGRIILNVTVNKEEEVQIHATVYHYDPNERVDLPPKWSKTNDKKTQKSST